MKKNISFSLLFLVSISSIFCQSFKVLYFHKTNGYRHTAAIKSGFDMVKALGQNNNWTVDSSSNSNVFTATNLAKYKVVIFANTSGDNLLTTNQQKEFENFIKSGNGFIGIHAATDTYRNKSWPWYNELVGGIVQTNPNHTANNTNATMDVKAPTHPIMTDYKSSTWAKPEEWYYWEKNGGYLSSTNKVLLEVRSTGTASYDKARPITWYKYYDGGRSYYTALGHNGGDFTATSDFGKMIKNAILWGAKVLNEDFCPNDPLKIEPGKCGCGKPETNNCVTSLDQEHDHEHLFYPNPILGELYFENEEEYKIYGLNGNIILEGKSEKADLSGLTSGVYYIEIQEVKYKLVKE